MSTTGKPTLVLLPGLLCDERNWEHQRLSLNSLATCHVADYGTLNSIEAMAEYVLSSTTAQRFAVAGHSMGGRVALEIVRQAPERVVRLALLDTGFQSLPSGETGLEEKKHRYALLAKARAEGMRAMGREWARGMVHPERLDTDVFEDILAMIEQKTADVFEAQIEALLGRPDASAVLSKIDCPTLLLCGREDNWSPLARHVQMQERIRGAALEVIERSGHMTTVEQPETVSLALAKWLGNDANLAMGETGYLA